MQKNIITVDAIENMMDRLLSVMHMDRNNPLFDEIEEIYNEAEKIAVPKALYAVAPVVLDNGRIRLNDVLLTDPFVYEMTSECEFAIPYVATCGKEIDEWSKTFTDAYEIFIVDSIKQIFLGLARDKLYNHVRATYFNTKANVSSINPGSLKEWPIGRQSELFKILGGVTEDIGVKLSDSFLMIPTKSVSGIFFQSAKAFENCQLCPRTDCPNRRTAYIGD